MIRSGNQYLLQLKEVLRPDTSDGEIKSIFRILKEDLFGIHVSSSFPKILSEADSLKFKTALEKLARGMPVQYVVGKALFYNRFFKVDERALIPRPETEELVILILDRFQDTPMRVLDVGTGSGCLAITLAAERPSWKVLGVDIEEKAIDLSLENARNLGVRAEFAVQDILKVPPSQSGEFDLIVSNPPYITIQEKTEMDEWVIEYEPKTALFVDGDDPLLFYKKILQYAVRQKNRPVNLFFELNPKYAKELKEWNRGSLNLQSDIHVDMSGKERFLLCRT